MSEPPIQPPPIPVAPLPYYTPAPWERPKPVMLSVITWASIIYGGYTALGLFVGVAYFAIIWIAPLFPIPGISSGPVRYIMFASMAISVIDGAAGIVLFIGGLKAMHLSPIGRKLIIGYCVFLMIFSLANAVFQYRVLTPWTAQASLAMQAANAPPGGARVVVAPPVTVKRFALLMAILTAIVYCSITGGIVFYLKRPSIRELFTSTKSPNLTGVYAT